jgi:hypothetical protein
MRKPIRINETREPYPLLDCHSELGKTATARNAQPGKFELKGLPRSLRKAADEMIGLGLHFADDSENEKIGDCDLIDHGNQVDRNGAFFRTYDWRCDICCENANASSFAAPDDRYPGFAIRTTSAAKSVAFFAIKRKVLSAAAGNGVGRKPSGSVLSIVSFSTAYIRSAETTAPKLMAKRSESDFFTIVSAAVSFTVADLCPGNLGYGDCRGMEEKIKKTIIKAIDCRDDLKVHSSIDDGFGVFASAITAASSLSVDDGGWPSRALGCPDCVRGSTVAFPIMPSSSESSFVGALPKGYACVDRSFYDAAGAIGGGDNRFDLRYLYLSLNRDSRKSPKSANWKTYYESVTSDPSAYERTYMSLQKRAVVGFKSALAEHMSEVDSLQRDYDFIKGKDPFESRKSRFNEWNGLTSKYAVFVNLASDGIRPDRNSSEACIASPFDICSDFSNRVFGRAILCRETHYDELDRIMVDLNRSSPGTMITAAIEDPMNGYAMTVLPPFAKAPKWLRGGIKRAIREYNMKQEIMKGAFAEKRIVAVRVGCDAASASSAIATPYQQISGDISSGIAVRAFVATHDGMLSTFILTGAEIRKKNIYSEISSFIADPGTSYIPEFSVYAGSSWIGGMSEKRANTKCRSKDNIIQSRSHSSGDAYARSLIPPQSYADVEDCISALYLSSEEDGRIANSSVSKYKEFCSLYSSNKGEDPWPYVMPSFRVNYLTGFSGSDKTEPPDVNGKITIASYQSSWSDGFGGADAIYSAIASKEGRCAGEGDEASLGFAAFRLNSIV